MNSDDNRDRLSELPDELLVRIISFLPISDAVQTMLLHRFGNLWTLLRTLEFDYEKKQEFVCNVLNSLKSPTINKLEFDELEEVSQENLAKWVDFALRKNTKVLTIFVGVCAKHDLPPCVFTSQSIVSLALHYVNIKLLPRVSMGSLRKLELATMHFSEANTLEQIISGCPCVRELVIRNPCVIDNLHFTAPNIKRLVFDLSQDDSGDIVFTLDCPNVRILYIEGACIDYLQFINVSSVREAMIRYCGCHRCWESLGSFGFEKLLHKFQTADIIQLEEYPNEAYLRLKPCGNDQKMAFYKNSWTRLALRSAIHGSCLLNICSLLKKSRCLEELIIYADVDYICDCSMLLHELYCHRVMRKLKTVTIHEYEKPSKVLLQLIKFVLKSAVVLDKFVISCSEKDELFSTEGKEFFFQLLSFPRASSKASIVFA